jgi:hypothetical protein
MSLMKRINKLGKKLEDMYVNNAGTSTLVHWVKTVAASGTITATHSSRVVNGVEYRSSFQRSSETHTASMERVPVTLFRASWSDNDRHQDDYYNPHNGWRQELYGAYKMALNERKAQLAAPQKPVI